MLKELSIRNFAIIDELNLSFKPGLTVITGETGAGKSILLGALDLILGERVDGKSFMKQDAKCVIEGIFDIREYDLKASFEEEDLDYDSELLIRREIVPGGKSRTFINDTPVNLKVLQTICSRLIASHQQFDTLQIQNPSFQLDALDAYAKIKLEVKNYRQIFKRYQAIQKELSALQSNHAEWASDRELWQFQHDEIVSLKPEIGFMELLEQEQARLANAETIQKNLYAAFQALSESEMSISGNIRQVIQNLQQASKHNAGIKDVLGRTVSTLAELVDIAEWCEKEADRTEMDPKRLEEIESRLSMAYRLFKKHNVSADEDLINIKALLEEKLDRIQNPEEALGKLQKELESLNKELNAEGEKIRKSRKAAALRMALEVNNLLIRLQMPNAIFEIDFRPNEHAQGNGLDEVNFLFSANKGVTPQLIKSVASGGEMSRLSLCVQSLVASSIPLPTMIYDEIDSGVSGQVALEMGRILQNLSKNHQVILITHSPQVASFAQEHLFVAKSDQNGITSTKVNVLSKDEHIEAIAMMLSTNPPTKAALANAQELVAEALAV